jgi:hypothetical protein
LVAENAQSANQQAEQKQKGDGSNDGELDDRGCGARMVT